MNDFELALTISHSLGWVRILRNTTERRWEVQKPDSTYSQWNDVVDRRSLALSTYYLCGSM